ncbi:hypothetical protein HPP92_004308 [Vanilla planifolia]|uniref:ATP synthase delta chain, chloroplastic n=1 Tax=Vanilla planifolia TaxID=51239 RepID=A0A835S8T5_VANPL|nr:hypothetical protein HPP92_004308 [Vanilla planifolia]
MASLRQSPAALQRFSLPNSTCRAHISSSLGCGAFPLRHRFSSLVISLPGRRLARGGSAAGATTTETVALSYASALAEVAEANNTLDSIIDDLEKVETIFSDPAVEAFFTNPVIAGDKKTEIINEIASYSELHPHTVNFLNILIEKNRINLIKEIVKEFENYYNELTGTEMALVSSVVKLDSQHLAQIAKTVQGITGASNVRIKTVIDPSLIGGFTIRFAGSKVIDMSVKKQLDEIAAQLEKLENHVLLGLYLLSIEQWLTPPGWYKMNRNGLTNDLGSIALIIIMWDSSGTLMTATGRVASLETPWVMEERTICEDLRGIFRMRSSWGRFLFARGISFAQVLCVRLLVVTRCTCA